jgi:hypothetical protein
MTFMTLCGPHTLCRIRASGQDRALRHVAYHTSSSQPYLIRSSSGRQSELPAHLALTILTLDLVFANINEGRWIYRRRCEVEDHFNVSVA